MTRMVAAMLYLCSLSGCLPEDFGVFLPTRTDAYALPENHIPPELLTEETLLTPDGERLAAIFARQPGDGSRATVLFLHGQGGNIDDAWEWVMRLWDRGFDVYIVDYRGFGKSSGSPSEQGLYTDAETAYARLESDAAVDTTRLLIWGYSLGTGVASYLALSHAAACLVLEAAYTSMTAMVELSGPYGLPSGWFVEAELDTVGRIGSVPLPIVVAHGTEDRRIPFWMGEAVFAAAHEPKRFISVEGAGHNGVLRDGGDAMLAAIAELAQEGVP